MRCFVAILVRAADRYNGYRPLVVCHLLRRQLRRMVDNILRVKSDVKSGSITRVREPTSAHD
jgi:hypothetical protein